MLIIALYRRFLLGNVVLSVITHAHKPYPQSPPEHDGHGHLFIFGLGVFMLRYDVCEIGVGDDICREEDEVVGDETRLVDLSQGVAEGTNRVRDHVTHASTRATKPRRNRRFDVGFHLEKVDDDGGGKGGMGGKGGWDGMKGREG